MVSSMSDASELAVRTSVVIPCFNEEGNLKTLKERLETILMKVGNLDVVLVDNGSNDSTRAQIVQIAEQLPRTTAVLVNLNIGYGNGIKEGLRAAEGQVVGWTHADLQTDPNDIVIGIGLLGQEAEMFIKGTRIGRPILDRAFTMGMSVLESILFKMNLRDINAQPTLFGRGLLEDVLLGPDDFSLDLHVMIKAKKRGFKEVRFPVAFGTRVWGESAWNTSLSSRLRFIKRTVSFSFKLRKDMRASVNCRT
jgi:glycosyltransferase involved in cell wall biosynthesis